MSCFCFTTCVFYYYMGYLDVKIAFLLHFFAAFEHLQQGYAHCYAFVNIKARKILPKKVEIISTSHIRLSDNSIKTFCQKRRKLKKCIADGSRLKVFVTHATSAVFLYRMGSQNSGSFSVPMFPRFFRQMTYAF